MTIRVLIVEDDPMVAEFNKRFLGKLDGFYLMGIVHNINDAKDLLSSQEVDLILLDIYMPTQNGLELLKYIREKDQSIDTILITAAADAEQIKTALRYGAADYLIKPFEFDRFKQALEIYKDKFHFLNSNPHVNQEDLDQKILSKAQNDTIESYQSLPKGVTKSTLYIVLDVIKSMKDSPFSTEAISEETNISRVSIRKYLNFLVKWGVLEQSLTYGIGRPVYLYTYKKGNEAAIKKFL